jgi:hypothetical protein
MARLPLTEIVDIPAIDVDVFSQRAKGTVSANPELPVSPLKV